MKWYKNKLVGRNEKIEKEFQRVFGEIEASKNAVHRYIKFAKENPAHSCENGGTLYTSKAIELLEKAQEAVGKYRDFQIIATKEGIRYADEVAKKTRLRA